MKVLGLTGLARSGKNLFCDIAQDILKKYNIDTQQYSLAEPLKENCSDFILTKCGLNVWSTDTIEKSQFRDMLVWYADFKRKQTNGKYWTGLLQEKMEKEEKRGYSNKLNIITDVRFNEYLEDEVFWIKHVLRGKLIHIRKYSIVNGEKVYIQPPNLTEAENDPKMKSSADLCIDWEHKDFRNEDDMKNSSYLRKTVHDALDNLMYLDAKNLMGLPTIRWKYNVPPNEINSCSPRAYSEIFYKGTI